jgi:TonB family protein
MAVEDPGEAIRRRYSIIVAVILHVVLLAIPLATRDPEPIPLVQQPQVYVMQQVRFQPPPPSQKQKVPEKKTRKVPIPDPTPDDPEPLLIEDTDEEEDIFDIELDGAIDVPAGPPSPSIMGSAMALGGAVVAPVKIHSPSPPYTEEARRARIQGVVVLQTVVDREGNVAEVKVLKGLPEGLTESATETVMQWRFEPATLEGEPVAVHFILTVSFTIQ